MGCDVGTQSAKALLVDDEGIVVSRAVRAYPTRHPAPGWAEQDPDDWIAAVFAAVHEVVSAAGVDPRSVRALGIDGQVDGVVAVDRANRALAPAPIWMDRRASAELTAAERSLDRETIRAITGANPDPSHGGPKLAWLRGHLPDRPDAYLPPASYVVARLTGERVVDAANASSLLLFDLVRGAWSGRLLEAFGAEERQLPAIRPATGVAGSLDPRVASELGLSPECAVIVGTGDEHAAAVAANLLEPGLVCDVMGTAEPVAAAALEPVVDPLELVETHAHAVPGRWLVEHPGFISAGTVRWLAEDVLGCDRAEIAALAADAPAGAAGVAFVPALGGASTPRWNPSVLAAFTGLTIGHDRRHLARAVVEGCALAVRAIVERLSVMGLAGDTIRVVGGAAREAALLQLRADVTRRRVERLEEPEASALGAALLAAVGVGVFPNVETAVRAALRIDRVVYEPDPRLGPVYDELWFRHRRTFDALESLVEPAPGSLPLSTVAGGPAEPVPSAPPSAFGGVR
ncbi:MAG TPA: FGGY family carbohydrate kinase [Candidatus Limnocylindrales bacterium]